MSFERTKELSAQIFQLLKELYSRQDISNLEKDLLKEKLRQLYDIINEWPEADYIPTEDRVDQAPMANHFENKSPVSEPEQSISPPDPEQESPTVETSSLFAFESEPEVEPEIKKEEEAKEPEGPKVENTPPQEITPEAPVDNYSFDHTSADQVNIEDTTDDQPNETTSVDNDSQVEGNGQEMDEEAVKELFELEEVKELSDKLSQSPITDLTKALGINDRLLTVNELFSGDFSNFDESFRKLNQMDSFEDAKSYLMEEVVAQHNWVSPDKKARAKRFIKFVRRRYLN